MLTEPKPSRSGLPRKGNSQFYSIKKKIRFVTRKRKPSKTAKAFKKSVGKASQSIVDEVIAGLTT